VVNFVYGLWDSAPLTAKHNASLETWRQKDWELKIWRRNDLQQLLSPEEWGQFLRLKNHGQQTDLARYYVLREKGGLYADLDVYSAGPMDEMLQCGLDFVAVEEFSQRQSGGKISPIANYFFAATAHHPITEQLVQGALERLQSLSFDAKTQADVLWSTGPGLMTDVVHARLNNSDLCAAVLGKHDADKFVNHHARAGWRSQFKSWREHRSYTGGR
jgi:mannosyltransferase OCH1-like enzyme